MSKNRKKHTFKENWHLFWQNFSIPYFIRDVVVVICGIVFTIGATSFFEQQKRKAQIKVSLGLVRDELKDNIFIIGEFQAAIRRNMDAFKYFRENAQGIDTISRAVFNDQSNAAIESSMTQLRSYAVDILNSNAHYEELDNRLLMRLAAVYNRCNIMQKEMDDYNLETKLLLEQVVLSHTFEERKKMSNSELLALYRKIDLFNKHLHHPYFADAYLIISEETNELININIALLDSLLAINKFDNLQSLPK